MSVNRERLGAFAAALALTASAGLPMAQAAQSRAQVTLSMWAWADRYLCAQEYHKQHPEVTIKYNEGSAVARMQVLKRAGSTSGYPDVYFDGLEQALNDARLGFATPLDDVMPQSLRDQYAPGTLTAATYQGHIIAAPHDMAAFGVWYNVNVMKAAGLTPPTSHEQIWADAAKLAKAKKYFISFASGPGGTTLEELGWANSPQTNWFTPVDNTGNTWRVTIDTPRMRAVTQAYVNAVRGGGILPDDAFHPVSGKAFGAGQVAYAIGPNWLGHYVIEPTYPKQKGQWSFAASLPSVGWWGGAVYMVPPQSQHIAEAKKLAIFCSTSPAFQSKVGTVPSFRGVHNVAGAFQSDSWYANPAQVAKELKKSALNTGKGWYFAPNQIYVDAQAGTHLLHMVQGSGSVASELAKMQSEVVDNLKLVGVNVK